MANGDHNLDAELSRVHGMLERLCRRIVDYDGYDGQQILIETDPELKKWWDKVIEEDTRRKTRQDMKNKNKQLLESALAKLSPEEKRLIKKASELLIKFTDK